MVDTALDVPITNPVTKMILLPTKSTRARVNTDGDSPFPSLKRHFVQNACEYGRTPSGGVNTSDGPCPPIPGQDWPETPADRIGIPR